MELLNSDTAELTGKDPKIAEYFYHVRHGQSEKVKTMLKQKVVIPDIRDIKCVLRPTALHIAAEADDVEMIRVLLAAKPEPADVNAETTNGRRPIWWSTKNGNKDTTNLLLRSKLCEVNFIDKESGCSPLFQAVLSDSLDVVQQIVHAGGNVNQRSLDLSMGTETPLMKAVQLKNKAVCECLMNSLCNIQAKTEGGLNALHFAIACNCHDIAELLLHNNIKIHAGTANGANAMTVAIEQRKPDMVALLIKYGYKIDKRYKWKETPLQQALHLHAEECAISLIHGGVSLDYCVDKQSILFIAVNAKLLNVVKLLVAHKPQMLNERWIRERRWPVSIYRRPDIVKWLSNQSRRTNSLMELSRSRIFGLLGKRPISKIDKLCMPEKLQDYLKFSEFDTRRVLEKQKVFIPEICPFDCPVVCFMDNCPVLDVSSDSDSWCD